MSDERTDLEANAKEEIEAAAEPTRTGPVFVPRVDIFETEEALTVLADMPGVVAGDLDLDVRDDVLTIHGRVTSPESESESELLREYRTGDFHRTFSLSQLIDRARIEARLTHGVLRLTLPKVERAQPRKIEVRTD